MTKEDCLITRTLIWSWMGDIQCTKGVETHSFEFPRENTWREREWCGIFKACAQTWGDWLEIFLQSFFEKCLGLCHEAKSSLVAKEVMWIAVAKEVRWIVRFYLWANSGCNEAEYIGQGHLKKRRMWGYVDLLLCPGDNKIVWCNRYS